MKRPPPPTKSADQRPQDDLPEPPRATLVAAAVYAVATMLLAYPALAGQILFNPRSDQYLAGYAFRDFAAQSLRAGHGFPQWNPFLQGGLPYIAAMHGDIFYPTFLLRMILPTAVAMTWEFAIHLCLAGLFTYLFLRAWRIGFYPALIGGLAYMMGGSIAGYASPGHDGKLFVGALLPAALLLLTRGMRDGRRWAWGAFAITIGLAFLSPQPQAFQYLLLVSGCFTLYLAFSSNDGQSKLPTPLALKRLGLALSSVVVGLMIGAVQFLPALIEYKPWSPRAAGHDWATATSYSFPIEETINAYLPQFSGILDNYWGQNNIHLHSDYFGVVVLILLGAAFGATVHKSFRRFWVGTGIVSLLWAYGGHTPLFHLIILVPYTKYLRAPSIMIYVTAFAVSMLVAIGAERVLARRLSTKYAIGWGIAGLAVALFMTVGGYQLLVNLAVGIIGMNFDSTVRNQTMQYYQFAQRAETNTAAATLGAWRSFLFVALGAGVVWGFMTNRIGRKAAAIGLAALVTVDLWSIERLYWIFSPPASITFASDPAIEAINSDIAKSGEPGRVLALAVGSGIDPYDPAFRGSELMAHSIRVVQGYHGNELEMYHQLLQADSGQVALRPQFWRHENVRYFYTGIDEASLAQASKQMGVSPFVKLAGPVRNAGGSMVYAYRIPGDNPAAWVAGSAVSARPDQLLPTVLDPRFDATRAALIDTGASISTRDVTLAVPALVTARVSKYEPGHLSIDLSGPATDGSVLVVSENYFPGWKATSGTTALPTSRANYNLIGVGLTAGTRHVDLTFIDSAYVRGKRMTLVALLIAVGGLIAGLAIDRRRPVAPAPA
jgi:hypothetical protein